MNTILNQEKGEQQKDECNCEQKREQQRWMCNKGNNKEINTTVNQVEREQQRWM